MKKKLILTLVLGCLLGGLLFYIIFFEKEKIELEEVEKLVFSNFDATETINLTFKPLIEDRFVVTLKADGWQIDEPFKFEADRFAIDDFLNNLTTLAVDSLVEENAKELDKYGLENATMELRIKNKTAEYLVSIGEMSFDGKSRYLKKGKDKNIYFIEATKVDPLLKKVEDFMDRNILDINANDLNRIKYNYENDEIILNLSESGKWSLGGSEKEINQDTVQGFVTQIANLDADSFYGLEGTESLSFDNLIYQVELGFAGTSNTLLKAVREEGSGENLILKVEGVERDKDQKAVLYRVSEAQFKALLKSRSDYEQEKQNNQGKTANS